jgi:hypothetical protein
MLQALTLLLKNTYKTRLKFVYFWGSRKYGKSVNFLFLAYALPGPWSMFTTTLLWFYCLMNILNVVYTQRTRKTGFYENFQIGIYGTGNWIDAFVNGCLS